MLFYKERVEILTMSKEPPIAHSQVSPRPAISFARTPPITEHDEPENHPEREKRRVHPIHRWTLGYHHRRHCFVFHRAKRLVVRSRWSKLPTGALPFTRHIHDVTQSLIINTHTPVTRRRRHRRRGRRLIKRNQNLHARFNHPASATRVHHRRLVIRLQRSRVVKPVRPRDFLHRRSRSRRVYKKRRPRSSLRSVSSVVSRAVFAFNFKIDIGTVR